MRSFLSMGIAMFLSSTALQAQPAVLCDSSIGYRECQIGPLGTPVLSRELSNGRCFEGVSWGAHSTGRVWVDDGCVATFTLKNAGEGLRASNRVICESEDEKRQTCRADVMKGVTLARQLSRTACIEGTTWGYDKVRDQIWVEQGCRAEFIIGKLTEELPPVQALDAAITCESDRGRRKQCAGDTGAGVQLVRRLSEATCRFGREWGFDQKGIWVDKGCRAEFAVRGKRKTLVGSVTCESKDNTRALCAADTLHGIALIRQFNENPCILGESWGFDQDGVWVTNGCHGQFILGGFRLPPGAVPAAATLVTCESKGGHRTLCKGATGRGVGLIRQLSEANCVLNRSWGYDATGIWVSDGCRADFAVAK